MTEIKGNRIDSALRGPFEKTPVILIHGPDSGLVSERARQAALACAVPLDDPFLCIRGDADGFLAEQGRLVDEARSISMFGGRRLIWLRLGARQAHPAVEALLAEPVLEATIILEAGELRAGHALRSLCERAENAICIACYADESESLERLVAEMIRADGKSISADALALLTASLGADRALTRGEVNKLLLYVGASAGVEIEDIEAIITDAARIEPTRAIDLAFSGQIAEVEPAARRAIEDGMDAGALLGLGYRHAQSLLSMGAQRRDGTALKDAIKRHGVHFRREPEVARHLSLWAEERIMMVTGQLAQAVADCRKSGALAPSIAIRTLWTIALAARRAG